MTTKAERETYKAVMDTLDRAEGLIESINALNALYNTRFVDLDSVKEQVQDFINDLESDYIDA